MHSIQLTHPFGLIVSGGTKTGKTTFVKQLHAKAQENITYFYSEYQVLVPGIHFVQGIPDSMLESINPQTRNLYIIDDTMCEKDAVIAKLFKKKSHHVNLSVIYIVQNMFHQSKDHRTISLNVRYLVLTKDVRDASQVIHLDKQLYPSNTKFFQQAYQLATKQPYSYVFVDQTPTCPNEIRLRSAIFPTDIHFVYQHQV